MSRLKYVSFKTVPYFQFFYVVEIECNAQFDAWFLVVPISKDNIRNIVTLTKGKGIRKRSVRVFYRWPPVPPLIFLCSVVIAYWRLRWQYSETRNTSYTFLMERFTLQMQTINYVQCCCQNLSNCREISHRNVKRQLTFIPPLGLSRNPDNNTIQLNV